MEYTKVHLIGIGGVGMSATAKLLRDSGATVTGSDEEVYPPISDFLRTEGFDVRMPYAAKNIPADADLIVIGKNAKLVPESNPEVAAAYSSGKKILSFPEVLAQLSHNKDSIVVAGSYGKSTSTALLAHVLDSAGVHPSWFIGASPLSPARSAAIGTGNLFILEGDEYPASNTDPRSKFLLFHPRYALITPLAHDHFNIFPTPAEYLKPFYEFAKLVEETLVVCAEGPLSQEFLSHISRPVITYGIKDGQWHADNIVWGEKTSFNIVKDNQTIVRAETSELGEHAIQNIVGVAALVFSLNLVSPQQFASAIATFRGLRRRLDKKSDRTSIPVFEGFGSSYDKAKSAIAAMKRHFSERRLVIVFEPNTISWRSRAALSQYDDVFNGAAEVIVYFPPHDGKETELSLDEIVAQIKKSGIDTYGFTNAEELLKEFGEAASQQEAVLLLSSGAMGGLIESLPKLLEQKFPA